MFLDSNHQASTRSKKKFAPNRIAPRSRRAQRGIARASSVYCVEMIDKLESRRLLTTLAGGGPGRTTLFEFLDGSDNDIRVALRGNIVVELLGYDLSRNRIVDMQTNFTSTVPGPDLFQIYIAQADMDSSISIARVPKQAIGNTSPRPMQPFTGSAGTLSVTDATTNMTLMLNPAGSSGGAFLGARTSPDAPIDPGTPIINAKLGSKFGVRPAPANHKIVAGVFTAPGVSIGQFLFGGTILGKVDIEGSCNLFYAGQLWTGDASGLANDEQPTFRQNFYVGGDLRSLVTMGSIGTLDLNNTNLEQMDYKTGFDMKVVGHLGEIYTRDSYLGATTVLNDPTFFGPGTDIQEVETRTAPFPTTSDRSNFQGDPFGQDDRHRAPSLGDTAAFDNDTPATAQLVGTARNANNSGGIVAQIDGQLDGSPMVADNVDYYSMALLAGQTVQVQLTPLSLESIDVGVFDPLNRIVASDYSNLNSTSTQNLPFRFTAVNPGVYKFAVAWSGDLNFNGVALDDQETSDAKSGLSDYQLLISRAADIGFGGIVAGGNIANTDERDPTTFDQTYSPTIDVEEGDLGALYSIDLSGEGESLFIGTDIVPRPITVKHGNLRAIQFDSIGLERIGEPVGAPDLLVPRGAVGLLRSTGEDSQADLLSVNLSWVTPFAGTFDVSDAIGFDYQVVDSNTIFAGNLMADRGIGIIRADQISTADFAPRLAVNADNRGNDGFIDLIDVRTSLGTLTAGGPAITTGNGGNVRYIHVGNPANVFRDRFFGGGTDEETLLPEGQAFRYTDDSGATVKLSTTPIEPLGTDPTLLGALNVETYGIRDKGGSVLINVDVFPGVTTDPVSGELVSAGRGLQVDTGSAGGTGSADIGSINIFSPGTDFIFDPLTRTFNSQISDGSGNAAQPSELILKGKTSVSVFDASSQDPGSPGTLTGFSTIDNRTTGELVNIEASSIGLLQGQNIGVAYSKTKAVLEGIDPTLDSPRINTFPFSQQNTLIRVTGDIQTIRARGAVGNFFVGPATPTGILGNIGELSANTDGVLSGTIIDGIDAPIVTQRSIVTVNIGQMITPSGSGDFELSGIFAGGAIGTIKNQGTGSDIRGDVVSLSRSVTLPTGTFPGLPAVSNSDSATGAIIENLPAVSGIGSIQLTNGALIDTDLMVTTSFDQALELPRPLVLPGPLDSFFPTVLKEINEIQIKGIGGIIGTTIDADTIGTVTIQGGFGFIDSSVGQTASSTFDGIDTDGYGVRLSTIDGGATLDHVVARGNGHLLSTLMWTPSVRLSESQQFDPYSGRPLTQANDLHRFLGTTRAKPTSTDQSMAGTIEDTTITGSRDLNLLSAYRIFGRPGATNLFTETPLMRVSFAENIGKITAVQDIDGLDLTAGVDKLIQTGRNFLNDTLSIDNQLGTMIAGGNIKASTTIDVTSGEGTIDAITTGLAMFGRVAAAQRISRLTVGTDLGSPSISSSRDIIFAHINGSILNGALLRAANNINQLIIGHNIDKGGTVRAKRILNQTILGQVRGDIIIS